MGKESILGMNMVGGKKGIFGEVGLLTVLTAAG